MNVGTTREHFRWEVPKGGGPNAGRAAEGGGSNRAANWQNIRELWKNNFNFCVLTMEKLIRKVKNLIRFVEKISIWWGIIGVLNFYFFLKWKKIAVNYVRNRHLFIFFYMRNTIIIIEINTFYLRKQKGWMLLSFWIFGFF